MPSRGLGAYSVKIHQIVFGALFVLLVLVGVRGMMAGGTVGIKVLAAASLMLGGVLALDKYYWLVCPLLLVVPSSIPGLPFNGSEIGMLLLCAVFFVRSALRRDQSLPFQKAMLLAAPYFFWVCMIWMLNPTGIAMLGSDTIGGRFYFQILLAFVTLGVFSRLQLTEKGCKYWFVGLIVVHAIKLLSSFWLSADLLFLENSTNYFLRSACPLALLLLCRYEFRQIFQISWRFPILSLLVLTVLYSGKRTWMGQVLLAPYLLVFFRNREKLTLFILSLLGAVFLGFIAVGHGRLFDLPYSMQRSMSFLPGKWDRKLEHFGTKDLFRESLHRQAKESIAERPFLGTRGFAFSRQEVSWLVTGQVKTSSFGHTDTSSWHNKWYGMAADFGLPASFFWYLFAICAAAYCYRRRNIANEGGYKAALFLYYSLFMFYDLFFAFGHSAVSPFEQWTYFGFLLALSNSVGSVNTPPGNRSSVQVSRHKELL